MLVADAQLNVAPTLAAKQDILANTIEFALAIGIADAASRCSPRWTTSTPRSRRPPTPPR